MNVEPPVRFLLRSRTIWAPGASGIVKQSNIVNLTATTSPKKTCGANSSGTNLKRRKVTFATTDADSSNSDSDSDMNTAAVAKSDGTNPSVTSLTGPTFDLGALSSPCQFLRQKCARRQAAAACPSYVASLKLPELSRHVFYISTCEDAVQTQPRPSPPKPTISLLEYLQIEPKTNISVVQQFKLALRLARAVLQYHSTPWLQEEWCIQHLQLMLSESEDSEDLPLYLSLKLMSSTAANSTVQHAAQDIQMANTTKTPLSRAQKCGINNMALFCLGTALLEIGHWKSASELFDQEIDDNLVDTVRRLAYSSAKLGKYYDKIVSKCLRCNFGDDTDLSRVELVKAVYEDVVCPLEDLVSKLDGLKM